MVSVRYTEINAEEDGQRLDNYLLRVLKGVPRSHIYRMIRNGEVRLNKKRAQASSRVYEGDSVRIPPVRETVGKEVYVGDKLLQRLQESIVYEDNQLLVVNKPAGIAVHGGSGLSLGIIEALRKIRPDLAYLELIHRLDRDTSGCLLLAKKRSILRSIHALLAEREVCKTYWALLAHSWCGKEHITVSQALEKSLSRGERIVCISDAGKASLTDFKLLENYQKCCFVEVSPRTGRTHQIRVHSAYLHHPVLGDVKYGGQDLIGELKIEQRLYLHARAIQFTLNGKQYRFEAELDGRFASALQQLRKSD